MTQTVLPENDSSQVMTQKKSTRFWIDSWIKSKLCAYLTLVSLYLYPNDLFKTNSIRIAAYSVKVMFHSTRNSAGFPRKWIYSIHNSSLLYQQLVRFNSWLKQLLKIFIRIFSWLKGKPLIIISLWINSKSYLSMLACPANELCSTVCSRL